MDYPSDTSPFALVVDDDAMVREVAAEILQDAGFRTYDAENGDAAVGLLQRHHDDIVLLFTDVHMPGSRNGFALARYVSRQWPSIAIVVASGQATPGVGDLPEGARFIPKPFSSDMIHAHLQEILPDGQKPEPLRRA